MADDSALSTFVDKWRQREPEMALLEPFCAPAERALLPLVGALFNEFTIAMFETSDAAVAHTKLGWWAEDLAGGRGGARHPLSRALFEHATARAVGVEQWREFALAARVLADAGRDAAGALPAPALARWAEAAAAVEARVFAAAADPGAVALCTACDQLLRRGGDAVSVPAAARTLLAGSAAPPRTNLYRGGRWAFDRWRLTRLAGGRALQRLGAPPAWRALLLAWGAARRSRAPG